MTESRSKPEPPLAAAQEAKVAILKTADAVRRRAATLLSGRGITFQQYNVLRILRGAKAGPLATAQLAQRTIEVIADLDGLLEDLERKQLVRRTPAETGPGNCKRRRQRVRPPFAARRRARTRPEAGSRTTRRTGAPGGAARSRPPPDRARGPCRARAPG